MDKSGGEKYSLKIWSKPLCETRFLQASEIGHQICQISFECQQHCTASHLQTWQCHDSNPHDLTLMPNHSSPKADGFFSLRICDSSAALASSAEAHAGLLSYSYYTVGTDSVRCPICRQSERAHVLKWLWQAKPIAPKDTAALI